MEQLGIIERISELEREIAALPPGSVNVKKVRGNEYHYHRYTRNGERSEIYIPFEDVEELRSQIEKRKALEAELKTLKNLLPKTRKKPSRKKPHEFKTSVRIGEQLRKWAMPVEKFKRRECYTELWDYVFGEHQDKVFILYGLRRTGKTTLIRQVVLDMASEDMEKAAFIQVRAKDTLSDINADLKYLEENGYHYVFIDEVTLMEDFIEGAALFSDIYASSGMKIVLSGVDSLGFVFAKSEQLYDRCIMLHTTFIPYREFENVLGIKGIDEFIRYGGTMSMSGVNYNERSSFATIKNVDEYVDSAIARNIQHSLKYYQDSGHFRLLYDLYQKNELTSAINRVVEDLNHRFTKHVLTRTFKFNRLYIREMLEILEKHEQLVEVDENHAYQIREYLLLLDLIIEIDLIHFPNVNDSEKKVAISQPGLRYAQAEALVNSLLLDEKFNKLTAVERSRVLERVMSTIKGQMMEDIVLLETKLAYPKKRVFQLQFAVGEFDMVIHDSKALTCEIYEIKHSREIVPQQYQHLTDEEKCAAAEHRYGTIIGRYVIYRGEPTVVDGIQYLNVEDYLKSL